MKKLELSHLTVKSFQTTEANAFRGGTSAETMLYECNTMTCPTVPCGSDDCDTGAVDPDEGSPG